MNTEARLTVSTSDPEICYAWDNGAKRDSVCRILRSGLTYYLHRGDWPAVGAEIHVFVIPKSVAIEMRRLVVENAGRSS